MSLIPDTYTRFRVLIHEIGKFGIVGIVSTVITFALQNALYGHVGPTTQVFLANAIYSLSAGHWLPAVLQLLTAATAATAALACGRRPVSAGG